MSNTPGISPITPDIEDVRRSEEDDFFGEERDDGASEDLEEGVDDDRDAPATR